MHQIDVSRHRQVSVAVAIFCLLDGCGLCRSAYATYCVENDVWSLELVAVEQIKEASEGPSTEEAGRWDSEARFWQYTRTADLHWYQGDQLYMLQVEER